MPDETTPPIERRSTFVQGDTDALNPYRAPATLQPQANDAEADGGEPSDGEQAPSPREDDAARAFKSALFGVLFFPLQLYTLWLLLLVVMSDEPLRPRYFWYAVGAAAVLVPHVLLAG